MAHKRKRGHGGLKFMAFLVTIPVVIVVITTTSHTELGQRLLGNREDQRLEHTALTPRFGFASASLRISVGEIYNSSAAGTVDLTMTKDVTIDRQSSMAKSEIKIERTATQVAPGVSAVPYDAINATFTQILTKDRRYESAREDGQPWTYSSIGPHYYGTEIDEHYIPMIDDIMGFELRGLPTKPSAAEPPASFKSTIRRRATGATPPSAVSTSYTYEFDLATFRRAVPILATRTTIYGPPETPVTLTVGFDEAGLLRFADVGVAPAVASALAEQLGPKNEAIYRYTLQVDEISGEPVSIDVPTDVVEAPTSDG